MHIALIDGFLLAFVAGLVVGINILPIKWQRIYSWENFWLVYSVVSLLLVPIILALWLVPHLGAVYSSLPSKSLLRPFLFGALWGFAQLGAGVCVYRLGFALSGAILNGTGTAVGTLAPLMLHHREMLFQASGLLLMVAMAVTVAGVASCGLGGYRREQEAKLQGRRAGFAANESAMSQAEPTRRSYVAMVVVAVISGILSALLNIALSYGGDVLGRARAAGAAQAWAPFALWPIALLGGSIVNLAYSVLLLSRNKTWGKFKGGLREAFNPVLAGCLWMGGIALYSSATTFLGVLGVSIGFALFTIIMILTGQFAAIFTREWHRMRAKTYAAFVAGIVLLCIAVVIIASANYFT